MSEILLSYYQVIGTDIAATRKELGVSQDDLAKKLGWDRTKISKTESNTRRLDMVEFIQIAEALSINPLLLLQRVLMWATMTVDQERDA